MNLDSIQAGLIFLIGFVVLIALITSAASQIFLWKRVRDLSHEDVNFDLIIDASIATSNHAVIMVNETGMIEKANHHCYQAIGWPVTLIGEPLWKIIPERFRYHHVAYMERYIKDPRVRQMGAGRDLYLLHNDGSEIPVQIGLTPLVKNDGSTHVIAYISPTN